MKSISRFWHEENGQDLIEYTLLMAFVALASAALFLGAGGSILGIWTTTNNQLVQANSAASTLATSSATASSFTALRIQSE